jgi:hypothetical protein
MDEANSFHARSSEVLPPNSLSPVEDWCGTPVVIGMGLAVEVVPIASIVQDPHDAMAVTGSVSANAGRSSNAEDR